MTTEPEHPATPGSTLRIGTTAVTSSDHLSSPSRSVSGFDLPGPKRSAGRGDDIARPVQVLLWALVAVCVAFGLAARAWVIFHTPLTSDEAVTGISAQQILHGHLSVFYPGVAYGGVEQYVYAVFFAIFGQSGVVIHCCDALLWSLAAVLTWRVARHLVASPELAGLAGAVVWAAPYVGIFSSTTETAYRGTATDCGLGCVLVALRMLDGKRSVVSYCSLGVLAGLGLWSTPEIVYFLVPTGLILLGVMVRDTRRSYGAALARLGAAAGSFCLGALPWLWWNVNHHFDSLKTSALAAGKTPLNPGFVGRLHLFFRYTLPMEFGLRLRVTGVWLFGNSAGIKHDLLVAVVAAGSAALLAGLALALARGGRFVAVAVAVMVFPLFYAGLTATWYWEDGRYAMFLPPLLSLVGVVAVEQASVLLSRARRATKSSTRLRGAVRRRAPLIGLAVLSIALVLSIGGFHKSSSVTLSNFTRSWADPDQTGEATVADLEALHVRFGFADYWVAYKLDFLSHNELVIGTSGTDVSYIASIQQKASEARPQAWIFVPADELAADYVQFGATPFVVGPDGESEADFVTGLRALGVPFRVARAGLVDVVFSSERIDERTVGIGLLGPTLPSG